MIDPKKPDISFTDGTDLQFVYTNHKNEIEERHVKFEWCVVGEWPDYEGTQLFLHCRDYNRGMAPRTFAVNRIDMSTFQSWQSPANQDGPDSLDFFPEDD